MAICDSKLFFARNVKVLIEIGADIWEIPVLDGFSFAQANNSSEIVLSEMESTGGQSRRGKRMFNDSLAPAEWSFSTYTRPFKSAAGGAPDADSVANIHAVEEVLWALAAGPATRSGFGWSDGVTDYFNLGLTSTTIDFNQSNRSSLGTANIYFKLEDTGLTYKVRDAVVNEMTINFDIEGIAAIEWSGLGAEIVEEPTNKVPTITESLTSTSNFIRNRLTQLQVRPNKNANITVDVTTGTVGGAVVVDGGNGYSPDGAGQTVLLTRTAEGGDGLALLTYTVLDGVITAASITTPGSGYTDGADVALVELNHSGYTPAQAAAIEDSYNITLTGGSITLSNNLTYITPEELGIVNIPIGHVTGTRSVSGSFTAYLVKDPTSLEETSNFWSDLKNLTTVVTHSLDLKFSVGGTTVAAGSPVVEFNMPNCHVEIPTHNIDDVIALETTFSALGTCISSADEMTITYKAL